jgi:hypothetical protein
MVKRLNALAQKVFSLPAKKFLPALMLLVVLTHLPFMKLPAVGNHVWRQCNTLAVAKNYADESMNLLEPRVDKRFEKSGITGPQFPAYEYILACMYRTMGFSEHYHRWLSLIFTLLSVWAMHKVISHYTGNPVHAAAGSVFIASTRFLTLWHCVVCCGAGILPCIGCVKYPGRLLFYPLFYWPLPE